MATGWYWQEEGIERGPVSFRELAQLVREQKLNELDLVRPDYSRAWQPAHRTIGLYYMAGRVANVPVLDDTPSADAQSIDSLSVDNASSDAGEQDLDEWLPGTSAPGAAVVGSGVHLSRSADAYQMDAAAAREMFARDDDSMQAAINAASAELDRRGAARSWLSRVWFLRPSETVLRQVYRITFGLVVATLLLAFIDNWSRTQLQRYPDPALMRADIHLFPFWGPATSWEYWFLLADTGLVAGLFGYAGAKLIEVLTLD